MSGPRNFKVVSKGSHFDWFSSELRLSQKQGQKLAMGLDYVHVSAHKDRDVCIHLYTEYVYVCVFLLACVCTSLMTPTEPWIFAT